MFKKKDIDQNNGHDAELVAAMATMASAVKEIQERLEELEDKKSAGGEAQLLIAKRVFDTDEEHLSEMTKLPIRAVRPYSIADMSASVLSIDVQSGKRTLGQIRRASIYRHLRSVGGDLLNKGSELAMEQIKSQELIAGEKADLGGGF